MIHFVSREIHTFFCMYARDSIPGAKSYARVSLVKFSREILRDRKFHIQDEIYFADDESNCCDFLTKYENKFQSLLYLKSKLFVTKVLMF